MALTATAKVLGSDTSYVLASDVKRYTLRDTGFLQTRNGNFQLDQPLSGESPYAAGFKLKITVDKDLQKLKMSITDKSGLHPMNIFKNPDKTQDIIDHYNFAVQNLIDRHVLQVKSA